MCPVTGSGSSSGTQLSKNFTSDDGNKSSFLKAMYEKRTRKCALLKTNCLILIFVFQGELLALRIGGEYNKNIK